MNDQNSFFRKIDNWAYGQPGGSGALGKYEGNGCHIDHAAWHSINTAVHAVKETATNVASIGDGKGWNYPGTKHQAGRVADHVKGIDPYTKK